MLITGVVCADGAKVLSRSHGPVVLRCPVSQYGETGVG